MIQINFKQTFKKQLQKIPQKDQKYILQKLEFFKNEETNVDIKEVTFFKIDKRDKIYFNI